MSDFRNHLARMLENPEFQKEYENGTCSPTIATLEQLASGMGKKLRIEFV